MWWVIHMCRGFDPLFSLWQDRARSFWGIFSHPPTPKRSFGVLKLPFFTEFDLLGPKFHFSLDLFGSNFQRPAAHPHHFSDRVPPPGTPHTDPYKHFFLCRTIPEWNSLPASAVEATSVESFKTHLAGRPQRDQPWSGTPTHPRHTPEEDCGLRYQTRPDQTRPDHSGWRNRNQHYISQIINVSICSVSAWYKTYNSWLVQVGSSVKSFGKLIFHN